MRHVLEPYYKLIINGEEPIIGSLNELREAAKHTSLPYEIYEYRKSLMESPLVSKISIESMKTAAKMKAKGVSVTVIANELNIPPKYLSKIFNKNNLALM